jgi:predicted membrane protein
LRSAELPEGDSIVRIKCVFGGVVLLVPETWYVDIRTSSIFGGAADSRLKNGATDKTRKLIIAGECVFGGCEIK